MQSGHPGSVGEYLQNRILHREHKYQIFSFYCIERGVFPREGYHEPVVGRS
jgi:hypothetical protein